MDELLTTENACKPVLPLPVTLTQAIVYFSNPDTCFRFLASKRWTEWKGISCPTCGGSHIRLDRKRRVFECNAKHPKRQFSIKVGTLFEDSPLPLEKWLPCVWMIASMKNGVSSHEIARSLGVTQKTAWFMLHRIRLAMQEESFGGKLHGTVEVDETFIGGKARNMHFGKRLRKLHGARGGVKGKVAVMGLLERHETATDRASRVRLRIVKNTRRPQLQEEVEENVQRGSAVMTDALKSYDKLTDADYMHAVIDHAESYVNGNVHTNGLENFWSLLKRSIHGTYVNVMPFHLFRYLDEQAFRFNNRRHMTDADRFNLAIYGIVGRRLTYKELLGDKPSRN
jgi:transposase-like protein